MSLFLVLKHTLEINILYLETFISIELGTSKQLLGGIIDDYGLSLLHAFLPSLSPSHLPRTRGWCHATREELFDLEVMGIEESMEKLQWPPKPLSHQIYKMLCVCTFFFGESVVIIRILNKNMTKGVKNPCSRLRNRNNRTACSKPAIVGMEIRVQAGGDKRPAWLCFELPLCAGRRGVTGAHGLHSLFRPRKDKKIFKM